MQDRYAGDIGDFGKFGLLKELSHQGLSIGVNWYKTLPLKSEKKADGTFKQDDGRHKDYLSLAECDMPLAVTLTQIAAGNNRSIQALEEASLLSNVVYYDELVSTTDRTAWHNNALEFFKNHSVDLVFLDPDNGLLVPSVNKSSPRNVKYAFYDEVMDYIEQGQSVLVYNHRSRKPEYQYFLELESRIQEEFSRRDLTNRPGILEITFPRFSVRDYFAISIDPDHLQKIRDAFTAMFSSKWAEKICQKPLTMDISYTEYKSRFLSAKEFKRHYQSLPEQVVRGMIDREKSNTTVKACMYDGWKITKTK